jgi:hypothetical protein
VERDTALVPGRIYSSLNPEEEFGVTDIPMATDQRFRFEWSVNMAPGETRYWSNTMWRPYLLLKELYPPLAAKAGLESRAYGSSIEGRELVAYANPDLSSHPERPTILITSGFHPVEGDTVGTEAILEWLGSEEGRRALERYNIMIAPIANPDGSYHAYNGCNAAGQNFFWDFRDHEQLSCPEAYYLWRLIRENPPLVYVDFHCYSIQGPKRAPGAYIKSPRMYSGKPTKDLAERLSRRLDALPNTRALSFFVPSSLAFKITDKINTITFAKYHLHQDLGREKMRELAVQVVITILEALSEQNVRAPDMLLEPFGRARRSLFERFEQQIYRARYMYVRTAKRRFPILRRVRF